MINPNPTIPMGNMVSNPSTTYGYNPYGQNTYQSNTNPLTKFTVGIEQEYRNLLDRQSQTNQQQALPQQNPYYDYLQTKNSTPLSLQQKIESDPEFQQIGYEFISLINQALQEAIMPSLLQNQDAYVLVQRFSQTYKNLKKKHEQEDAKNQQELENLLRNPKALEQYLAQLKNAQNNSTNQNVQEQNNEVEAQKKIDNIQGNKENGGVRN